MLTKKYYKIIAKCINDNLHPCPTSIGYYLYSEDIIKSITSAFKSDNPNFDYDKFISACYKDCD